MDSLLLHAYNGKFPYPTPPAKTSGVYVITNTINSNQYVGSSQDIQLRWQQHRTHLRTNTHHCIYLQRAWNKHGEEAFVFQVVEPTSPAQCVEREQYWIDTLHPAYNLLLVAGSPRGVKASEATREKLRQRAEGRPSPMEGKHHTDATKEKIRRTRELRGIPSPTKGRIVSDATRERMSHAKKDKPLSEAHKQAIARAGRNRKQSPESIEKTRQANLGKKHSLERVAKNRSSHVGQQAWNKGISTGKGGRKPSDK